MRKAIDLNADLGEGFGIYEYGADHELLPLVTSANIACGWHGGDPCVIRRAVRTALENGVAIGAHPGYPDRMGFGRRYMHMREDELQAGFLYQLGALDGICRGEGTAIAYVKPHGAMYNAAAKDAILARAIVEAIKTYNRGLVLLCPGGSEMAAAANEAGLAWAGEFFADRGYCPDGSLLPRNQPGAVIKDPTYVCQRVLQAVTEKTVVTANGTVISICADSVCLHGDNPAAVDLAHRIRETLANAGISLGPFAKRR